MGRGDHQLGILAVSHATDEISGLPLTNLGKNIGKSLRGSVGKAALLTYIVRKSVSQTHVFLLVIGTHKGSLGLALRGESRSTARKTRQSGKKQNGGYG